MIIKRLLNKLLLLGGWEVRGTHVPLVSFHKTLEGLPDVASVVDVGVAEGTPELYDVYKGKKFLLIEANPAYKQDLVRLCKMLPAQSHMVFCGSKKGFITISDEGRKSSSYGDNPKLPVPVERLDDLVTSLPAPYLLKIDVEGAEMDTLLGAEHTLTQCVAAVVEVRPQTTLLPVLNFMTKRGFVLKTLTGGGMVKDYLHVVDLVFTRPKTGQNPHN